MRSTLFPIDVLDRDLNDRSAVPRCECRDKPVQLTVERNLVQYLAAIGFKGGAEIVDLHAAQFGHQPVGGLRGDPAQPKVINADFAPATDDVVAFVDLL